MYFLAAEILNLVTPKTLVAQKIQSFSGPYFLVFGLTTVIYSITLLVRGIWALFQNLF